MVCTIVAWGYASGKFVQRRDSLYVGLVERVVELEKTNAKVLEALEQEDTARKEMNERVNTALGNLQTSDRLTAQEMALRIERSNERHEEVVGRLRTLEGTASDLQRQIDKHHGTATR